MKDQEVSQEYLTGLSKKTMYFWNDQDECFIKSVPGLGFWVKFKDKAEYQISGDSDIVVLGVFSGKTATKAEYEKY